MTASDALDANATAQSYLFKLSETLSSGDPRAVAQLFLPDGWFRDVLVFSWDMRSLRGPGEISEYLKGSLRDVHISALAMHTSQHLAPTFGPFLPSPTATGVSAGFTFETSFAKGEGFLRISREAESGEWKALALHMRMCDLKGYEEAGPELGIYGNHTLSWSDVKAERVASIERDPYVIIIGGGQTGLAVAARFQKMVIPTLIIENNKRIGDNWRKRYPTLALHTPKSHYQTLYQNFPRSWPIYTPRDKVANWLEQYAESQDLAVWTDSRPLPTPSYDETTRRWTIVVDRAGNQVTLHPKHIILAAGTLGHPKVPQIADAEIFRGTTLHASSYTGGAQYKGKRVLVVGAGNTSADICQDLCFHGASSVTMLQRSTTCVVKAWTMGRTLMQIYPDDVPIEVSDLKISAMPLRLLANMLKKNKEANYAEQKDIHDGLIAAGMNINMGEDGEGPFPLNVYDRFGGYWFDLGCAELIGKGDVKIKQGAEIQRHTEDGVVFTDGSSLDADVVIFATGYNYIRETMKSIFGHDTMEKTKPCFGLDKEGEIQGCYRQSGHPGLWYAGADNHVTRLGSKALALMIKAIQVGLLPEQNL